MFGEARQGEGVTIKESRYSSFDDGYKRDFNAVIDDYIVKNPAVLLADYREALKV